MSALTLPEYYGDFASTTVAVGGYTAGSGVLNVTSTSGMGNGSQQFHFTIFDAISLTAKAAGKVTAVNSGTQWSVTMTLDANANATDVVVIALSAGAMNQIRADISQFGTFANLPTTAKAGDRYKQTDGPYDFIYSGSAWQAFWNGYPVTLPPSGGWTSEGIAASGGGQAGTVHYTNGFGFLVGNSLGSNSVGTQYVTAPSTPYGFIARMSMDSTGVIASVVYGTGPAFSDFAGFVIGFRDSGGKYLVMQLAAAVSDGNMYLTVTYYNSTGSENSDVAIIHGIFALPMLTNRDLAFKIHNDGTDLTFALSSDGGQNFFTIHSEAIAAHIADATSVCWGAVKALGSAAVNLFDWTQTS